jgi:hypothetical protein
LIVNGGAKEELLGPETSVMAPPLSLEMQAPAIGYSMVAGVSKPGVKVMIVKPH